MKVLVIGGAGITGTPIVHGLLKRGCEVTILHRGSRVVDLPKDVKRIHADPYAKDSIKPAIDGKHYDAVIATYGRLRYVAQNIIGHTTRLISVGGAAPIYKGWGEMTAANPWETTQPTPLFLAENHRLATEETNDKFSQMVRKTESDVMALHQQGLLNVTHFRYPLVYGTNNICPAEWCLIRRARDQRKLLIMPAGGLTMVSRGYAENIAHAILLAVENPTASAGQIYNIADDTILYNHQWVSMVSDLLDHSFELIDIPFDTLPVGFRCTPPQLLYRHHCVADISKIKQQLDYREVFTPAQALEHTVRYYHDNPVAPGSEPEQNLGDPFDYAYEDAVIDSWKTLKHNVVEAIAGLPAPRVTWKHPYSP